MIPICILRNSVTNHYQVIRIYFSEGEFSILAEFTYSGIAQGYFDVVS